MTEYQQFSSFCMIGKNDIWYRTGISESHCEVIVKRKKNSSYRRCNNLNLCQRSELLKTVQLRNSPSHLNPLPTNHGPVTGLKVYNGWKKSWFQNH